MAELKRSCENCGNRICATSLVAIRYDECIQTGYKKHWRPRFDMLPPLQDGEDKEDLIRQAERFKKL